MSSPLSIITLVLILALVYAIGEIIHLATKLHKIHFDEKEVRKYYLNKVNNLPGDEAEFVRFINAVWGEIYPDNPDGWDYPAQVIRHVSNVVDERRKLLDAVEKTSRLIVERRGNDDTPRITTEILESLRSIRQVREAELLGKIPKS